MIEAPLIIRSADTEARLRAFRRYRETLQASNSPDTERAEQDSGPDRMAIRGPELWCELHRWALTTDRTDAFRWLARFETRIGCGNCRRHWQELLRDNPPVLTSSETLFGWSVRMHNGVNRALGKPQLPIDAALPLWAGRQCSEAAAPAGKPRRSGVAQRRPCRGCGNHSSNRTHIIKRDLP
jgi:hypothetical protein